MSSINVRKTTSYLFLIRVVKLVISLVSVIVTAKYFGVTVERDMWVMASAVITTVTASVWGPLNEIFRTKFVFIKEVEGDELARQKTASLVGFVVWFSILLGIAVVFLAKPLSVLLVSNGSEETYDILVKLVILLIPNILLVELSNICTSILNAYDVFYIPEYVGWITGCLNIIAIIILAPIIDIYALVVSTYVSGFILLGVLIVVLYKKGIQFWNRLFSFKMSYVWPFIVFAIPFFLPYFVGQLNLISEKIIAGYIGKGSISSVDYSRQFIVTIQTVLSSVLTTVMVPLLARAFINRRNDEFNSILKENNQTCFIIIGICLAILVSGAEPVCTFFFKSGRISAEALSVIIQLTRLYGIALIGVLIYMIYGYVLLSSNQRKLYATIGVAVQVFVFVLYVGMFKLIGKLWVLPVSFGFAHLFAGIIMFLAAKEISHKDILKFMFKSLFSIGGTLFFIYYLLKVLSVNNNYMNLLILAAAIVVSLPILLWGNGMSIANVLHKITSIRQKNYK